MLAYPLQRLRIYPPLPTCIVFLPTKLVYCQTLEKRSSSPPNPDFATAGFPLVDGPVLLAQPPNSSSAVTLGAGLKPPPAPGTIGVLAKEELEFPHPKSAAGALGCWGLLGANVTGAGAGAAGAGVLHSLLPQASRPDMPPDPKAGEVVEGAGAAGLLGGGEDRLKTELLVADGEVTCGGGELCVTGADKSKRSPMAEEEDCDGLGAGAVAVCVGGGDEKEENPPNPELDDFCWCEIGCWTGLVSKKPPPLRPPKALVLDVCGVARLLEDALPRLAKGSMAAGFGLVVVLDRFRPPKASLKPPMEACCCWPMPPNAC